MLLGYFKETPPSYELSQSMLVLFCKIVISVSHKHHILICFWNIHFLVGLYEVALSKACSERELTTLVWCSKMYVQSIFSHVRMLTVIKIKGFFYRAGNVLTIFGSLLFFLYRFGDSSLSLLLDFLKSCS